MIKFVELQRAANARAEIKGFDRDAATVARIQADGFDKRWGTRKPT